MSVSPYRTCGGIQINDHKYRRGLLTIGGQYLTGTESNILLNSITCTRHNIEVRSQATVDQLTEGHQGHTFAGIASDSFPPSAPAPPSSAR